MGCRQNEQTPEEEEIYNFFYKMMKETEFDYTILGYEKNYDKISQLSKNKFKKLEKKQNVRIGFVKEVMKYISKIPIKEREDHNTRKILFCSLILTLTLKHFLNENKYNYNIRANNDLQQSLLTMAVQILNYKFEKKENLKLIIYYFAQMLVLLFKEMNDINQYINIEKFIEKINFVTEDNDILLEKEKYNFIKINLACLGEFFINNYKMNELNEKYIDIIMNYFLYAFWENSSFIGSNYSIYKKEIFSENYLFNINEMILEKEKETDDISFFNKKSSLNSIKLIDSIISKNQSMSNESELPISSENLLQLRKKQNFIDLNQINENFYFFFKSIISDISNGKDIFNKFFNNIGKFIKSKKEKGEKKEISDFQKTVEILLLLLFVKCKINCDIVIIYSFIDFEGEFMTENMNKKKGFYEFIIIFFDLFKDDEDIYNRNLKLLSEVFLIELENLEDNEEFLIQRILQKPNQLELFISFLSLLIKMLKEDEYDIESIAYCLDKIDEIINEENIKFNNNKKVKREKYILRKEEFEIIFNFINLKLKNKETSEGKEYFNKNVEFFINILDFIDNYFSLSEVYENISCRNFLYKKIFSAITKLQIFKIEENEIDNINELISFIKQLINIIRKNTLNFFVDFEIIYKYIRRSLNKLTKIEKDDINFINFKLIYSTFIFIITQIKIIYGIPTSIINLNKDIIKEIGQRNNKYKEYFKDINIEEFQENTPNKNNKGNNKFYNYLTKNFSNNKNIKNKLILKNNEFKYLINLMENKLCGKNTPLIIYYKSQGSKIKNDKKTKDELKENLSLEDFDNLIIDEERNANDTLIISVKESINNLADNPLKIKMNDLTEAEESEENSYFNDTNSENINLPEKDEEEVNKKQDLVEDEENGFKEENSINTFKI